MDHVWSRLGRIRRLWRSNSLVPRALTIGILFLGSCDRDPRCESHILTDASSPDGGARAVLFLRSCSGALGRYGGNLSIVAAEAAPPLDDRGNTFVFRNGESRRAGDKSLAHRVVVTWLDEASIGVAYDSTLTVHLANTRYPREARSSL